LLWWLIGGFLAVLALANILFALLSRSRKTK
jgi:hypothetical protein